MTASCLRFGGFAEYVDFVVVQRLAVPKQLGTNFINHHVDALYPHR